MKFIKFMVIGLFGAMGTSWAAIIINQLPEGNQLIVNMEKASAKHAKWLKPGESTRVYPGTVIALAVDNKPSTSDYIKIVEDRVGGDKKYGRLTSLCSIRNGYLAECAISFTDQSK